MKPLILGVGNILLAMKVSVCAWCRSLKNALKFNRTLTSSMVVLVALELLDAMANREHLIIVDAVLANKQPGEIVVLHDEQVPTFSLAKFRHTNSAFCDVLSAMKLTDEFPKHLCLIGIQPELLESGIGLTETIKTCCQRF